MIHSYGPDELQTGTLTVPPGSGPHRVVVLVHGGFWRSAYRANLMEPLAADLVHRGIATWNIEYRAVGDAGGGYPGTLHDVAAAIDLLATIDADLDLGEVTVVGHSAGGHLALWLGGRSRLDPEDPGAAPSVIPATVVAQAAVTDLYVAAELGLGRGAVQELLGGEPHEVPDRYRVASPLSGDARVIAVHGGADTNVPSSQSDLLVDAERLDDPNADHFDVIDPEHRLWTRTLFALGIADEGLANAPSSR
jgi:acetyl esterase/lipase